MTAIKRRPMRETGYTQIDNKIFDAQPFLSPAAFGVLMRMVRMIDGYGNKDAGLSNTFLQTNCNMSKNTVSKSIGELVDFGFLIADRQQRKTTVYSLNYENIAKFDAKKLGQELASQNLASQNLTIRFPKSDQVLSQNLGSNKEKERKPFKEKYIEKDKKENPEPEKPSKQKRKRKHDFIEFEFTDNQKSKCTEYGINITSLLNEFRDYHEARGNQFVDWSKAFNTWINNHIKFNKLNPVSNGGNHANSQPTTTSDKKSSADRYAENLAEELAQRFPDEFGVPF